MRFIHTADWHLGNQMHDIDRKSEVQAFFIQLKDYILKNQIGTLIVSGDIFDTANPSSDARRLYYKFLSSLANSCCRNIIITGGNHDSALTLECSKELLEVMNIHVVGSINNLQPDDMVFELAGKDGNAEGICIALPFVRELELRNLLTTTTLSENGEDKIEKKVEDKDLFSVAYKKLYDSLYQAALKLREKLNIPIIATGHLYAADLEGRLSTSSSSLKTDDGVKVLDVLGTLGNVPPSVFPPVDYVALGHIHYSTMVAKNPAVRYSGSPFVMGFDEAKIPHYFLDVEISAEASKTNASKLCVEKVEVEQVDDFQRISGPLAQIKQELEKIAASKIQKTTYLELAYKREFGVNVQDFLDEAIKQLPQNVIVVSWKILESGNAVFGSLNSDYDASEIKNLEDTEIFTQLILSKTGLEPQSEEAKQVLEKFLPVFMQVSQNVPDSE